MNQILYVVLGVIAGTLAGLFGIGGGIFLVPVLVYLLGLTQHQAQGTVLAVMIPPIAILAVLRYYYSGNVKVGIAAFICIGFVFGALIGANIAHGISDSLLKKLFGILLLFVSLRMIFLK